MKTCPPLKRSSRGSSPSILIVDDFSAARGLVRELLAPLEADISEAENGSEALNVIAISHFDLIITDYQMPEMDGVTLCQELKKCSSTRSIPVLMLSNFDAAKDINRGFQAGATAYLSKHEAREQLLLTAERILTKSQFQMEQLILIVDDSSSIRQLVVEGLSHYGFKTMEAKNGLEALQCISKQCPNLILTDINMPKMDGFSLCQEIKSRPDLATIPIVVMSVNADRAHMGRMACQGVSSYIVKPFNVDELLIVINTLLSDQYLLLLKEKEFLSRERKLFLESISSLITALEARDLYTMGHSDSVARIATGMLALNGASPEDIERMHIGARLHDIGKIGVRDNVLLKPGKLTEKEFAHIQKHPTCGTKILSPVESLQDILSIVHSHHERIDGKGYPDGLLGEEIPFWARIVAVADTFDAMTSDRPYRKQMTEDKALQVIRDASGSQFCPTCVELFIKWHTNTGNQKLTTKHSEEQNGND